MGIIISLASQCQLSIYNRWSLAKFFLLIQGWDNINPTYVHRVALLIWQGKSRADVSNIGFWSQSKAYPPCLYCSLIMSYIPIVAWDYLQKLLLQNNSVLVLTIVAGPHRGKFTTRKDPKSAIFSTLLQYSTTTLSWRKNGGPRDSRILQTNLSSWKSIISLSFKGLRD